MSELACDREHCHYGNHERAAGLAVSVCGDGLRLQHQQPSGVGSEGAPVKEAENRDREVPESPGFIRGEQVNQTETKRAYKYRFYPDTQQADLLLRTFGCVRLVYNKALEVRTVAWRTEQRSISYAETNKMLTEWKRDPDLTFLAEVSSRPLQQALRDLQTAYGNFWAKRASYPKFKSKHKSRKSAQFSVDGFSYRNGQIKLAKTDKPLDIRWSRPLPEGAQPSSVTVSLDKAGRWHISILVDETIPHLPTSSEAVGVDMGLNHLAVLSTGEKINNPRVGRKHAAKLARAQKELARRQKGSANREKSKRKVARLHAKIADKRRDHHHKLTTRLVRENQTIVLEDLNIKGMSAKGGAHKNGMNRAIQDASWAELRSMLEYKAHWYGREVIVIDRWFPSSQMCSQCGVISGKKPLNVREWTCACGAVHDRDINAALNVKAAGLAVSVCGDGRSLRH